MQSTTTHVFVGSKQYSTEFENPNYKNIDVRWAYAQTYLYDLPQPPPWLHECQHQKVNICTEASRSRLRKEVGCSQQPLCDEHKPATPLWCVPPHQPNQSLRQPMEGVGRIESLGVPFGSGRDIDGERRCEADGCGQSCTPAAEAAWGGGRSCVGRGPERRGAAAGAAWGGGWGCVGAGLRKPRSLVEEKHLGDKVGCGPGFGGAMDWSSLSLVIGPSFSHVKSRTHGKKSFIKQSKWRHQIVQKVKSNGGNTLRGDGLTRRVSDQA
jgi:hypothetical protein